MTEAAFAEIVRSTKQVILGAVQKHLYERFYHAVDDVVQETYIRAYRALSKDKFEGRSKMGTWLYAIARNESLRMNEKLGREEKKHAKLAANAPAPNYSSHAEEAGQEELGRFYKAMISLPSRYASVLQLYWKGKTEKEIAAELAISKGTVKSRAFRGRELLKKLLGASVSGSIRSIAPLKRGYL